MLLIVTERGDLHADWLIIELRARGAVFARFNTEDYPQEVGLAWDERGGHLGLPTGDVPLEGVSAVWYRRPVPPRMPREIPAAQAAWARVEAREALLGVWRTLDARWVNHPDHNRVAESKLYQLRTAERLGFDIPRTLVTNEPERARLFLESANGSAICKPIYDGRVPAGNHEGVFFTSRVDADTAPLHDLGLEPYLFQRLVAKRYDIRVTVIGDEVFAARIDSQGDEETATDWRRGRPGHLAHCVEELPAELAERCVRLCRELGLKFGAIDLARRTDGGYTFFEINPNGQWAWVEQRTGLPLRERMADLLLAPPTSP